MKIKFKKLNKNAVMPCYKHDGDAGMDICSCENAVVPAHTRKLIHSGIAAEIPLGYELQLRPRSGLAVKNGIVTAFGTIDNGYKGDIGIILYNHDDYDFYVRPGDRLAQLVVAPIIRVEIEETDTIGESDRGVRGFGSTGLN